MDVDSEEKETSNNHIKALEMIEDNVEDLLRNVQNTMILLKDLDHEKENEIKQSIENYHLLLQSIESSLTKQINACREPLLLPLLPIGHKNQYISKDARPIHHKLFSPNRHKKNNKQKSKISKNKSNIKRVTNVNVKQESK